MSKITMLKIPPIIIRYQTLAAAAFCLLILYYQAHHPAFQPHLQGDLLTFQKRAAYFLDHGTWANIGFNEHQPGTLWLFVVLGLVSADVHDFGTFTVTTIFLNMVLLAVLFFFYYRHSHRFAPLIFALLLLASGPLLLYRFELIVGLLTLLAWHFFQHRKALLASGLLGIATSIKIYPIVLVPLLIAESLRTHNFHRALQTIGAYLLGVLLPVTALIATGSTLPEIRTALAFHSEKPVIAESIVGQAVMLGQKLTNYPFTVTSKNSIHGFTSNLPYLNNDILNYVWIPPILLLYAFIWHQYRPQGFTNPLLAFITLLVFVIFAKVLNPQYLWWPFFFLPFLPSATFRGHTWPQLLLYAAAALALTTIIFPLNYSEFLTWLRGQTQAYNLFAVIIIRNLFLLAIAFTAIKTMLNPKPAQTNQPT